MVADVTESGSHSISRPIRIAQFLREASDWSASADLSRKGESTHYKQLATVTRPAISNKTRTTVGVTDSLTQA